MNRDLEDSIQEDDSMQVANIFCQLSFKQSKELIKKSMFSEYEMKLYKIYE